MKPYIRYGTLALAALLVLSTVVCGGLILPASAEELITVDVTNVLQTGTAGGARMGINVEYWWDDQANRPGGSRSLSAALSDMGVTYWRFPGGEKSDGHLWSVPPFDGPDPLLARISSEDWPSNDLDYWSPAGDPGGDWTHPIYDFDEFMTDCNAANCEPVIVVAYDGVYKDPYPGGTSLTWQEAIDTAVAWVDYANNTKGYGIKYWEIGNECWNPGYMGGEVSPEQQAQDFIVFCDAMKAVDSTIWCGISRDKQGDWEKMLNIAAADIDFMSVHSYEAWDIRNYAAYERSGPLSMEKVDYAWDALQKYPAHKDRIKLMMTETGGLTFGIRGDWQEADLGHALMTFEMVAQFLEDDRLEFTQVWNTRWIWQALQGWPPQESEYDTLKPDQSFSAQGMALNILGDFTLENMVDATRTSKVIGFASHDPSSGDLNVFLINKDDANALQTTVTLQGYTPPASGTVWTMSGTGPSDMNPTFSQTGSVTPSGNQVTLTLPTVSITVIQFGGGSQPPPTDTPIPPTDTPVPPTDTPEPTNTPGGPTDTPEPPPTDTPEPPPTNTPGGGGTIFYDDFEDGDMSDWTVSDPGNAKIREPGYDSTYCAGAKNSHSFQRTVSTVGYSNIHLKYAARTIGMESGDGQRVEWYDGSTWTELEFLVHNDTWVLRDWTLPSGAADNSAFAVRFTGVGDKNTEWGNADNVEVTGE